MKLATLKTNSSRDGRLVVVSRDLTKAIAVPGIAETLQYALENWDAVAAHLRMIYASLNDGDEIAGIMHFKPEEAAAPLPRAYQWLDASAYVNHVELVRKSRGVEMPESFWHDPLMYQGASDHMLGACDDVELPSEEHGIDFEAEVGVITGDVPMGASVKDAEKLIRLIVLINDVSLRYVAVEEMKKGFGFVQAKPASSFSPVAVTPDELGSGWSDGKVHLPLVTHYNEAEFGRPNAGVDMVFSFPQLVAHAAKTRSLSAGTIIGSGTVSNRDRSVGSSCIVEKRTLEKLGELSGSTPFMKFGDRVRIEMLDGSGNSVFGAIDQKMAAYAPPASLR